ncbi:MAG TPA: bifunctional 4-hydroxy-2-oxoglutarate aldolase/2-dehydro-3-deoxy-phosphogluconate aldolase [Acidisarcina sp.]|nr:bifunctional 4-hydroxy-2-oxoglutarate aldolase/2-dehydro-3-deoxy-phosphogluconate aldolase [Acidisarcina sp.]
MTKAQVLARIHDAGLLPVLRASSSEQALALAGALEAGGITVLEITMTVPGAVEVIRRLVLEAGDRLLIGAGTVLDPETARACMLAGAEFIVSPSLNVKTIEICQRYGIAVLPGALTPTEVVTAWQAGADVVKVFPCSAVGGAKYLKALKAPLPQIELIPTGGVSLATASEFLEAGAYALGVGSDLVDAKAIQAGRPESITENARKYRTIVQQARGFSKPALHSSTEEVRTV